MRCLLLFPILISTFFCVGQGAGDIWYFGQQAGLDFSSGSPVSINSNAMTAYEGCAVISDSNGQVLFYTNGIEVFNSSNSLMTNGSGLLGNPSSTQSAVILPNPGNVNEFYIFVVDFQGGSMRYSIVDMSLSGGLGEVTSVKNILLLSSVTEKISLVNHANCNNFWVMVHKYESSDYYAFEVDAIGIEPPVVSSLGIPHQGPGQNFAGQMKFSPDGSYLASVIIDDQRVEVFDFDNSSGLLSNPRISPTGYFGSLSYGNGIYGIEFSPNSQYFYVSHWQIPKIWQFSSNSPDPWFTGQIITPPLPPPNGFFQLGALAGMQLGPDGKIYIVEMFNQTLSIINQPNQFGMGSSFQSAGVSLGSQFNNLGLPSFSQSLFIELVDFYSTGNCAGDSTTFNFNGTLSVDSVLWNFGDPTSGALNQSTDLTPSHIYTSGGQYSVQLIGWKDCISDTVEYEIEIDFKPILNMDDSILCEGDTLLLDFSSIQYVNYLWQDGSTGSTFSVTSDGVYALTVLTNNGCLVTDSAYVNFNLYLDPSFSVLDDTICLGDQTFNIPTVTPNGVWSGVGIDLSGTFDPSIGVGAFQVEYTVGDLCPSSDSAIVFVVAPPDVSFTADITQGCQPLLVNFTDNNYQSGQSSLWLFGDGSSSSSAQQAQHTYNDMGQFTVSLEVVSQEGCINSATYNDYITVFPNPEAVFDYDYLLTDTGTIVQFNDLSIDAVTWDWSFENGDLSSDQNPSQNYTEEGDFAVMLTVTSADGCLDSISNAVSILEPLYIYVPNSFTPNNDGVNDFFTPVITGSDPSDYELQIYNRWGELIFESNDYLEGWDGSYRGLASNTSGEFYAQDGVYPWKLTIGIGSNGGKIERVGHITLIK